MVYMFLCFMLNIFAYAAITFAQRNLDGTHKDKLILTKDHIIICKVSKSNKKLFAKRLC